MEFPIDLIKEIPGAIKTLTQAVDLAKWIADRYKEHREKRSASREPHETQEDDSMDDCFLKTLYLLRQESERKKLEYIKNFAQNTILSDAVEIYADPFDTDAIDADAILSFLMDIEQMTWRQLCLIEGFRRRLDEKIEIKGMQVSGQNGLLRFRDLQKLASLNYLLGEPDRIPRRLYTDTIEVAPIGTELALLMNLQSIPTDEIGRAFGRGMIVETITKTY